MHKTIVNLVALLIITGSTGSLHAMQAKTKVVTDQQKIAFIKKTIADKISEGSGQPVLLQVWQHRQEWLLKLPTYRLIKCITRNGTEMTLDEAALDRLIAEIKDSVEAKSVQDAIKRRIAELEKQLGTLDDSLSGSSDLQQVTSHRLTLSAEKGAWENFLILAKGYEDKEIIACGLNLDAWKQLRRKKGVKPRKSLFQGQDNEEATIPLSDVEQKQQDQVNKENVLQPLFADFITHCNTLLEMIEALKAQSSGLDNNDNYIKELQKNAELVEQTIQSESTKKAGGKLNSNELIDGISAIKKMIHDLGKGHTFSDELTTQINEKLAGFDPETATPDHSSLSPEEIAQLNARQEAARPEETKNQHAEEKEHKADEATRAEEQSSSNAESKRRTDTDNIDTEAVREEAKRKYQERKANSPAAKERFIAEFTKSLKADLMNRERIRSKVKLLSEAQLKAIDADIDSLDIAELYEQFIKQENYKKVATGNFYRRWKNRKNINDAIQRDKQAFLNRGFGVISDTTVTGEVLFAHAVYANKGRFARIATLQNLKRVAFVGVFVAIGAYTFYKRATSR
jgi:hypothetical protein